MPIARLTPSKDTWVDQSNPTTTHEDDTTLMARHILMAFDTSALAAIHAVTPITVIEARLRVWPVTEAIPSFFLSGYRVTAAWNENVDWNNKPTDEASGSITLFNVREDFPPDVDTAFIIDAAYCFHMSPNRRTLRLTNVVQGWIDGAHTNNGIVIRPQGGSGTGDWLEIVSSEHSDTYKHPTLEIEYITTRAIPTSSGDDPLPFIGTASDELGREIGPDIIYPLTITIGGTDYDLTDDLREIPDLERRMPFLGSDFEMGNAAFRLESGGGEYNPDNRDSILYGDRAYGATITLEIIAAGKRRPLFTGEVRKVTYSSDGFAEIFAVPVLPEKLRYPIHGQWVPNPADGDFLLYPLDYRVPHSSSDLAQTLYDIAANIVGLADSQLNLTTFNAAQTALAAQGFAVRPHWNGEIAFDEFKRIGGIGLVTPYPDVLGRLALHVWQPTAPAADVVEYDACEFWDMDSLLANVMTVRWGEGDDPKEAILSRRGGSMVYDDSDSIALYGEQPDRLDAPDIRTEQVARLAARLHTQARAYKVRVGWVEGGLNLLNYDLGSAIRIREHRRSLDEKCIVVGIDFRREEKLVALEVVSANWPAPHRDYINTIDWTDGGATDTYDPTLASAVPDDISSSSRTNGTTQYIPSWLYTETDIHPQGFAILVATDSSSSVTAPTGLDDAQIVRFVEDRFALEGSFEAPSYLYASISVAPFVDTPEGRILGAATTDSFWTDVGGATNEFDGDIKGEFQDDGGNQIFDGETRQLASEVVQNDGVTQRAISKGVVAGTAQDGDTVVFTQPFSNAPHVRFRGGVLIEPDSNDWSTPGSYDATEPQYEDFAAIDLTASGFDVRAQLRQKGATTGQSDAFAAGTMDAEGETVECNLDPADASDDTYTSDYSIQASAGTAGWQVNITVAHDSKTGAGSWTERDTQSYVIEDETTIEDTLTAITALTTNEDVRLRIKSLTLFKGATVVVTPGATVYYTSTDITASKTPGAEDIIYWEAEAIS